MTCACGKELSFNEMGLSKKFLAGGEKLCLHCLSRRLDVSEERLKEKIEEFLRAGCKLFVAEKEV